MKKEKLQKNPKGNLGKGPRGDAAVKSRAKPAAKEKQVEHQLVVAGADKKEKVGKQQVAASGKDRNVEKQLASPGADVQAEVKMSYERYMQIGYKELERLTHENYSLSGSADLASVANLFNPIFFGFVDAWKLFL